MIQASTSHDTALFIASFFFAVTYINFTFSAMKHPAKSQKINFTLAIVVAVLIVLIGLILYFIRFHGALSEDSSAWSDFGQYLSLFISIASVLFLGVVSVIANNAAQAAQDNNDRFQQRQLMPVLDVTTRRPRQDYYPTYKDSWYLLNCASAAARNISMQFCTVGGHVFFISMYSLQQNDTLELPWLRYASKIELYYSDAFDDNFYRVTIENLRSKLEHIDHGAYHAIREHIHISLSDLELNFDKQFVENANAELSKEQYLGLLKQLAETAKKATGK